MDFFILFAAMGLVALARVAVGLTAAPYGAIDWAAVRAQILTSLGAEAVASRAQREAAVQRRMAKRHRRWVRRADLAEGRAQALAAAKAARLAARVAAKAAARAKSAAVAERYGHAAQRAAAAVRAARKAALATGAVPFNEYGIKARKRASRGSTVAANAQKRAAVLAAAQQRNAAARAAADAANAAFRAREAAKAARAAAEKAAADAAFTARWAALQAARAAAEKAAARRDALAALLADRDAVRLAHAVVRVGAKAAAKEDFLHWLDSNGHTPRGEAFVAANEAAWTAKKAEEGYLAHFGFSAEDVVTADKAAYEWRSVQRAAREAAQAARRQVAA